MKGCSYLLNWASFRFISRKISVNKYPEFIHLKFWRKNFISCVGEIIATSVCTNWINKKSVKKKRKMFYLTTFYFRLIIKFSSLRLLYNTKDSPFQLNDVLHVSNISQFKVIFILFLLFSFVLFKHKILFKVGI